MRVSGFTIARDVVRYGYPLEESLRSLLPLVDELIVGVGDCDDGTWELVESIGDSRIAPFRSRWDDSLRRGGRVLSEETNKALDRCSGDWAVYLQADEVLHEDDLPQLRSALEGHLDRSTETMSLRYHHFYGSFDVIQDHPERWYRRATRIVRTGAGVRSVGDAASFAVDTPTGRRRPRRVDLDCHVHHYGWVRPPAVMSQKQRRFTRFYDPDDARCDTVPEAEEIYAELGNLKRFEGRHPAIMSERIRACDWTFDPRIEDQSPDWVRLSWILARWLPRRLFERAIRG